MAPWAVDGGDDGIVSSSPPSTGQNTEHGAHVRLISTATTDGETLGVVVGDGWRRAAELLSGGPRTITELLAGGPDVTNRLAAAVASATTDSSSSPAPPVALLADAEMLAPVPRPGKVVAIGRNYREHADEEGVEPPAAPLVFSNGRAASSVPVPTSGGIRS